MVLSEQLCPPGPTPYSFLALVELCLPGFRNPLTPALSPFGKGERGA
jgi:hypothetical protein